MTRCPSTVDMKCENGARLSQACTRCCLLPGNAAVDSDPDRTGPAFFPISFHLQLQKHTQGMQEKTATWAQQISKLTAGAPIIMTIGGNRCTLHHHTIYMGALPAKCCPSHNSIFTTRGTFQMDCNVTLRLTMHGFSTRAVQLQQDMQLQAHP